MSEPSSDSTGDGVSTGAGVSSCSNRSPPSRSSPRRPSSPVARLRLSASAAAAALPRPAAACASGTCCEPERRVKSGGEGGGSEHKSDRNVGSEFFD